MQKPSEDEIRDFAKKIGAVDQDGNYTEPRSRLAAGALEYRRELAKQADEQPDGTTAEQLLRLHDELLGEGFVRDLVYDLVVSIAPALVRRQGLQLNPKGTRTHE